MKQQTRVSVGAVGCSEVIWWPPGVSDSPAFIDRVEISLHMTKTIKILLDDEFVVSADQSNKVYYI